MTHHINGRPAIQCLQPSLFPFSPVETRLPGSHGRSRDCGLTMRRYLIPTIITACFAWIATVQVVRDPHWPGGYPVAVVLAGCAGFNWWWTFRTQSPRPPIAPQHVEGWTAFIEAGAVAVAVGMLAIRAGWIAWRITHG
jgi:hypothetical protein